MAVKRMIKKTFKAVFDWGGRGLGSGPGGIGGTGGTGYGGFGLGILMLWSSLEGLKPL